MRVRNHGKYTHMSKNNPRAIARCDYSGMMVRASSMIEQLEYRGSGLVKTGYRVNPKFADVPNPQNLTPLVQLDPVPITNARPDNEIDTVVPQILSLDVSGADDVTLTVAQAGNLNFVFSGELTGDIKVILPAIYNEFYVENATTGAFTLSLQIFNNPPTVLAIPRGEASLVLCDCFTLKFIHPN